MCHQCSETFKEMENTIASLLWTRVNEKLPAPRQYVRPGNLPPSRHLCPQCADIARSLELNIFFNSLEVEIGAYSPHFHDVEITIDCMERMDSFNKWIFISGSGDLLDLCKYLKHKKKKIELWNFRECSNSLLETYADKIHFIDDSFLYKKPIVKVFGFNKEPEGTV